ncbi:MarR family transcriptional regulator [Nostocales cyanobacterium LEGE 11386]|nr:MarR family transcriptional regulator [Nostocales cyanobacterium LEGE 11386]
MKIDGKFYPLQNSEWVTICKSLTKSQISVLYYLRSLDPYGNGIRIKASKIAEDLGITKRAVNAAIAVLEEKGYINLEDIDYSVKVSARGCFCDTSSTVTKVGIKFPAQEENFPPENGISYLRTEIPTQEENFPPENGISHLQSETLVKQESQDSNINKTYSDFIDSLSEDERESFLEFGQKKAAQLPKTPELPLKWIEKNFEELRSQWEKLRGVVRGSKNWESDPRRQEWLDKIRSLGFATFIYENGSLDKQRKEFYEWANSHNLIWGDKS